MSVPGRKHASLERLGRLQNLGEDTVVRGDEEMPFRRYRNRTPHGSHTRVYDDYMHGA